MKTLNIGDRIPDFSLIDPYGKVFRSKDHRGTAMVLYSYPKDESAFWTKEACAFRDTFTAFTELEALVLGINSANIESHSRFALKNGLPFTLLSDPGNMVLKKLGIKPALFISGRDLRDRQHRQDSF